MSPPYRSRYLQLPTLRVHALEAGQGAPVLMLHGFPDLSRTWRFQLPVLAAAGFHVLAPDLRGYGGTDRPNGLESYRSRELVGDVLGLLDAMEWEKATLVGHDWGAVIAWHFAMAHPERLERLVIINGPHPVHYARMLKHPRQLLRSWYAGAFLIPWLPERLLGARGALPLLKLLETSAPGAFTAEDRAVYREALTQPGALTAMLNYYRAAAFRDRLDGEVKRPVEVPTLVIWGDRDPALAPELASVPRELAPSLRIHRIPRAAHFSHLEAPNEVNRELLAFLS